MISLPATPFTERLIRENGLAACVPDAHGFAQWAFVPGMTFGTMIQWWGDRGLRERPHEGVDLCLYQDRQGEVRRLHEQARLPAMYGGIVARLCDDFLGRSVIIERDLPSQGKLYVMYGHTVPRPDLEVGQRVQEGEVVAYLAPLPPHKTGILPHLHVSLGWAPDVVSYDRLDWERIPDVVTLLDPVLALDRPFRMIEPASEVPALRALTAAGRFCNNP
jgi:murein DD-endopeptidase MepM/ murein hydrolase activator NlpD